MSQNGVFIARVPPIDPGSFQNLFHEQNIPLSILGNPGGRFSNGKPDLPPELPGIAQENK